MNTQNPHNGTRSWAGEEGGEAAPNPRPLHAPLISSPPPPPSAPPKPAGVALGPQATCVRLSSASDLCICSWVPPVPPVPRDHSPHHRGGLLPPPEACQAFLPTVLTVLRPRVRSLLFMSARGCALERALSAEWEGVQASWGPKGAHTSRGHWGGSVASALQILEEGPGPGVTRPPHWGTAEWQPDTPTCGFRPSSSPRTRHRGPGESLFEVQRFSKVGVGQLVIFHSLTSF